MSCSMNMSKHSNAFCFVVINSIECSKELFYFEITVFININHRWIENFIPVPFYFNTPKNLIPVQWYTIHLLVLSSLLMIRLCLANIYVHLRHKMSPIQNATPGHFAYRNGQSHHRLVDFV